MGQRRAMIQTDIAHKISINQFSTLKVGLNPLNIEYPTLNAPKM